MTGPRPDTWMPFLIGPYLADTMHLSTLQHGAYMLLLLAYWRNGGPLPDDDGHLRHVCKLSAKEWTRERPVLARFFQIRDSGWHQKRADQELARAFGLVKVKSEAGKEGAAKRWRKGNSTDSKEHGKAIADPLADAKQQASQTDAPLPLPSPKEGSDPRGSDAGGASALLGIPLSMVRPEGGDWRKALFNHALPYLGGERRRSLLGKWLALCDDDAKGLFDRIAMAQTARVADPVAWVSRGLKPKPAVPRPATDWSENDGTYETPRS